MNISTFYPSPKNLIPKTGDPTPSGTPGTPPADPTPVFVAKENSSSISPVASFLSQLDQLQQQSPTQYSNAASSIATQLQADATTAQNNGNTAQAKTLTQLAAEFQNSAQSGEVPSAQVLQKALAGHHSHHGHHAGAAGGSSTSTSTSTSEDASTVSLFATALLKATGVEI
jgi:hypothetical protein